MNFTYMSGAGLVSGVVKAFPVSSLSLARKLTRKKRARHTRMTKWDPKSRDHPIVRPDKGVGERTAAGRSIAMRLESRVGQRRDWRWLDQSLKLASSRSIAHVPSGPTRRRSHDLGSHFVIRVYHARLFLIDLLANERELTGKTFPTPLSKAKS